MIEVENIFLMSFLSSVRNMGLFLRGHLHILYLHLSPSLSLSPIGYVLTLQPPSVTINIYSCPLLQRVPSSS
jgi:hypothetical protein